MQALLSEPLVSYGGTATSLHDDKVDRKMWQSSSIYLSRPYQFPDKIAEMFQKLSRLTALKAGWDSYGAQVPSDTAINEARSFLMENYMLDLPFYFLAPGVNGEVMIEFQKGNRAAELYFLPTGQNELILFKDDEAYLEGTLQGNFRHLISFFNH